MEKADFGIEQNWAIWARLSKKFPYGGLRPEIGAVRLSPPRPLI